ncbi:MAG: hypothetical protein H7138_14240 [Myxococcales bacterium]|nr:hypothetical protein [Myxococcales bacterium]
MRLLFFLVAVSAWQGSLASSAFGDPAPEAASTSDRPCHVRIIAAPEPVRAEIEAWVAAERRCSHTLEVRIEASHAGLQVFARDDRGHVRERVVPDGQSIGALIVSWIADDAPAEAAPVAAEASDTREVSLPDIASEPITPLPPPTPTPPSAPYRGWARPVAQMTASSDQILEGGEGGALSTASTRRRWLTLTGALSVSDERKFGVRADLDLTGGRWWSAGLFAAQIESSEDALGIALTEIGGFVAVEAVSGDWQVRVQGGLGAGLHWVRNHCTCDVMGVAERENDAALRPVAEVGFLIGRSLGARWSLAGGALLSSVLIEYGMEAQELTSLMMFAGLRSQM